MIDEPFGVTIFCDDIRFELNGKISLVGCYSTEILFHDPAPGVLPTFAALINVRIPIGIEYESIQVRAILEEGGVGKEIFSGLIERDHKSPSEQNELKDVIGVVTMPIQWRGLELNGSSTIKIRGEIDGGEELRFGGITIRFPEDDP